MQRWIAMALFTASGCAREWPVYDACPFTLQPGLNRGLAGNRTVYVAAPARDGGLHPALFVFHGHGGDPLGEVSALQVSADVADAGLVVLSVAARDANATPVWDDASDEARHNPDLSLFDGLQRCALEQLDVDPDRVTTTGVSGGAFFALFLARVRGEHLAAAVAFSGVMRRGVGPSSARPALLVHYGGSDDVTPALDERGAWTPAFDFTRASREQVPQLREAGFFTVACNSGQGHGPSEEGPALLRAVWTQARRGDARGFSLSDFPQWCSSTEVP